MAAAPTIGDCRKLNRLVKRIRDGVSNMGNAHLRFWKLKGPLRLLGYPDAAFQNNKDRPGEGLWRSSEGSWGLMRVQGVLDCI